MRNIILKESYQKRLIIDGKPIIIFKEIPIRFLRKREGYKQLMILLGDFNAVPILEMDRQTDKGKHKQGKLPNSFQELEENMDLIDAWRYKHPIDKQFTFFSENRKRVLIKPWR
uniref:Endonuclease/exonuclease/phosphatase domain-containing protein n=1 Tax=Podarcis muralis TaxID=64176 RepID=A0A670JB41_PODMU